MYASRPLPGRGAITVESHHRAEKERQALVAVAHWASGCLGHDDREALAYERRTVAAFDGGESANHVVGDIATQVETAGKPSLASFAAIVFTQAMEQSSLPSGNKARQTTGLSAF